MTHLRMMHHLHMWYITHRWMCDVHSYLMNVSHSYVTHHTFIRRSYANTWVSHLTCWHMTYGYDTSAYHLRMGWLRSVGSIKLQVSFAEYCLFYRSILQKRPIILSILLSSATPYDTLPDVSLRVNMWDDSFMCVRWLIHMWHASFIRVIWLIHMCDVTHSYVWHDSFIRAMSLIHACDVTHSYAWHDSFIRVTWLSHTCDMTHS